MSNSIITQENFNSAKSLFEQVREVANMNNENLRLSNERLDKATNLIKNVGDIYAESKRLDNENLKLKNELATIVSDFKLKQSFLQGIFAERSKIINKHFEVIDKGLRENNDDLVLQGLRGASEFVSTNPLDNFDTFKNVLTDKNKTLELDF